MSMTHNAHPVVGGLGAVAAGTADLILFNGRITTLDRQAPEATALAIRNGQFVAVGDEREVMTL
ncbi:hypothetical protein AA309_02155, partial [Microvirga vignae]